MIAPDTAPRVVELCASASANGMVMANPSKSSENTIRRIGLLLGCSTFRYVPCPFRASHKLAEIQRNGIAILLRCSACSFEFHFIRVAVEAQEKPAATLTCLLNVSSILISVVMRSLAICL
jgi:hypothetical protein